MADSRVVSGSGAVVAIEPLAPLPAPEEPLMAVANAIYDFVLDLFPRRETLLRSPDADIAFTAVCASVRTVVTRWRSLNAQSAVSSDAMVVVETAAICAVVSDGMIEAMLSDPCSLK